jgi:hypothetical protein
MGNMMMMMYTTETMTPACSAFIPDRLTGCSQRGHSLDEHHCNVAGVIVTSQQRLSCLTGCNVASYSQGIHQMYILPRFSWSLASSISRAAWPCTPQHTSKRTSSGEQLTVRLLTCVPLLMLRAAATQLGNSGLAQCGAEQASDSKLYLSWCREARWLHDVPHHQHTNALKQSGTLVRLTSQLRGRLGMAATPSSVPDSRPSITHSASFACNTQHRYNAEQRGHSRHLC